MLFEFFLAIVAVIIAFRKYINVSFFRVSLAMQIVSFQAWRVGPSVLLPKPFKYLAHGEMSLIIHQETKNLRGNDAYSITLDVNCILFANCLKSGMERTF